MIVLGAYLDTIRTLRSAIIPYIIMNNGELLFLLGRDSKTLEITDLGGGVKKNETALSAGIREINEETNKIFGYVLSNPNILTSSIGIVDDRHFLASLFVRVDNRYYNIPDIFKKTNNICGEISELLWFTEAEFVKLIYENKTHKKMWSRLKKFYKRNYMLDLKEILLYTK